jgi:hypothetical protein
MNENAEFINDESKLNLQAGDLFDRIINLKFTCLNTKTNTLDEFVIRSDYELIYPDCNFDTDRRGENFKGKYIIRRCTQKPSIKVQCKMVTSNVGTQIGVTISNFFILTKDGKHLRSFNAVDYKITSLEIVMGYWGQLKNSLDPESENALEDYFNIKAVNGADAITMTGDKGKVIVVTTEKLPPDSALHIKGYVADIYSSPVGLSEIDTPEKAFGEPVASSGSNLKSILYESITRRYFNEHAVTGGKFSQYKARRLSAVSPEKSLPVDITITDGKMSEDDAEKYGVKVYLSEEAEKIEIDKIYDSDNNEQTKNIYFESGWTIGHTIARIMSYLDQNLDYTFTNHGDVIIYTSKEMQNVEKLTKAMEKQNLYKDTVLANSKLYNGRIPAVYNINVDAVATIVCPFFTFIEPFQYVEFASRYALTSLVSYYASYNPTIYRFLVISASISFATVDDVNEVQITAVSAKGEQQ